MLHYRASGECRERRYVRHHAAVHALHHWRRSVRRRSL